MLPKNPFNSSYSEMIDSNMDFLSLFDSSYLSAKNGSNEMFLTEEMFGKTVFFSSASGGGKSSMFHFFMPAILNAVIQSKEQFEESYNFLNDLGAIKNKKADILGVYISCARNYEVIEDIYENGRRKQVFFALLNVRVLKEALKSILVLLNKGIDELQNIQFLDVPNELNGPFHENWNGYDYYMWACNEENVICNALNDMADVNNLPFMHNYLSIIQLLRADNILYNKSPLVGKVLIMFDDVHRLTRKQRSDLRESLVIVRAPVGVWLAQRTYGLSDKEILGLDGSRGREYILRKFEDFSSSNRSKNEKSLKKIADRRVEAAKQKDILSFLSCISESLDLSDDAIGPNILRAKKELFQIVCDFYSPETISQILEPSDNILKQAIDLRIIKILIDRKIRNPQMCLDKTFLTPSFEEAKNCITSSTNDLRDAAWFYLCIEYGLPFYYGIDKLCALSFGNVYQFLTFSGAIFDRRLSYRYNARRKRLTQVSAVEQDDIVHKVARNKWEELPLMFVNSKEIMDLLHNIAFIGVCSRNQATASYGGGAFTGIGMKAEIYENLITSNEKIIRLLLECVSNNLLHKQEGYQGTRGTQVVVFYLNRWICALFNIPLAYGGWKNCNRQLLMHIFNDSSQDFELSYPKAIGGDME